VAITALALKPFSNWLEPACLNHEYKSGSSMSGCSTKSLLKLLDNRPVMVPYRLAAERDAGAATSDVTQTGVPRASEFFEAIKNSYNCRCTQPLTPSDSAVPAQRASSHSRKNLISTRLMNGNSAWLSTHLALTTSPPIRQFFSSLSVNPRWANRPQPPRICAP